jgi:bifunctional DNA-binding transcriptional regulator/antitoxin component of YhaV-PrlF toxin-antitoxin module
MVIQRKDPPHEDEVGVVGETTITGKNQVSLPARGLRRLGWDKGDRLIVRMLGDDMMALTRRPENWADAFSGKMGHVFGTHEDTMRFLEEERRDWEERE